MRQKYDAVSVAVGVTVGVAIAVVVAVAVEWMNLHVTTHAEAEAFDNAIGPTGTTGSVAREHATPAEVTRLAGRRDVGAPCGPKAGPCPRAGQCCDERVGWCVSGPDACLAVRTVRGAYDGPPGALPDPYTRPGDGARSSCPSGKGMKCGQGANATCPWSPYGPELCCVQNVGPAAGSDVDGTCEPCERADGDRLTILWDGRWSVL